MQTPDRFSLLPPHAVAGVVLLTGAASTGTPLMLDSRISLGGLKRSGLRFVSRIFLALAVASSAHAATISGNVSNLGTGNLLQGARVEIPALGLSTLADETGRYVLGSVPAGTHELVVTYLGLDSQRTAVAVTADQTATRNFDLTTGIYKLDAFKVRGEREGDAAAITAARNADNLKNVVATDSFGNLPNLNAAEVAIRLPGIAGNPDDAGTYTGFTIRGMGPGLNSITLDGGLLTGQGGMARNTMLNNFSGTMLDQLELVKGHTPDKGADSLGGTINLKPLPAQSEGKTPHHLQLRHSHRPVVHPADSPARGPPRPPRAQPRAPRGLRCLRRVP